jgi:hypothetical protein
MGPIDNGMSFVAIDLVDLSLEVFGLFRRGPGPKACLGPLRPVRRITGWILRVTLSLDLFNPIKDWSRSNPSTVPATTPIRDSTIIACILDASPYGNIHVAVDGALVTDYLAARSSPETVDVGNLLIASRADEDHLVQPGPLLFQLVRVF